jgi:hypothetical protein
MTSEAEFRWPPLLWQAMCAVSLGGYFAVSFWVRCERTPADFLGFFGVFVLLSSVWGITVWMARRDPPGATLIFLFAILFRLALLPAGDSRTLLYSREIWRCLWDGHSWQAGVNPMRVAPSEVKAEAYGGEVWNNIYRQVEPRDRPSPYPAAAQAVFSLAHGIKPGSVYAFKGVILVFDLCGVWLVWLLARRTGAGNAPVLAYAWNPLVIKEFAGSAHIDAAWISLALAGIYFRSSLGAALAALVRPSGLLLAAAVIKRGGWKSLAAPVIALVALYAQFGSEPEAWIGRGTFNAAIFRLIPLENSGALAAVAGVLVATAFYLRRRGDESTESLTGQALWLTGAFLLASPRLTPASLTWILPFAALRWSWFWLVLSGSIFLSYHVFAGFPELKTLTAIEYGIALAGWMLLKRLCAKPQVVEAASRRESLT